MEGIDERDLKVLPSFIRGLLEKEESERISYAEKDTSSYSEETYSDESNFILMEKSSDSILYRNFENLPHIEKDKPNDSKETFLNGENLFHNGKETSRDVKEISLNTENFIDKICKKNETNHIFIWESENLPDSESNKQGTSKETFWNKNLFIFKKNETNDIFVREYENIPVIGKDKPSTSKETFFNANDIITSKNYINNIVFSHKTENMHYRERNRERNSKETPLAEENFHTEKMLSEYKPFICFTYYDKNEINCNKKMQKSIFFWRKKTEEPPYCVIEEKFVGYPPRNQNDLKKLLEFSESHQKSKKERLIYVPRRPRVMRSVRKKWTRQEYFKMRNEILGKITFFHSTGVIVWVPLVNCQVRLVHSLVQKFGDIVMLHDRWIKCDGEEASWGGVLVVYATPEEAEAAKTEIPKSHEFMKTLGLSELIQCLVSAELGHFDKEKAEIFVNAPGQRNNETLCQLETLLQTFGQVIPEDSYQVVGEKFVRITTVYSYVTYAFLAKTVLDGLPFGENEVKVELTKSERVKAILTDFDFHLQDYIGRAAFLFS